MATGFDAYRAQAQAEAAGKPYTATDDPTETGSGDAIVWLVFLAGIVLCCIGMVGLGIFGIVGGLFGFGARAVTKRGLQKIAATESKAAATVEFGIGCSGLIAYSLVGFILLGLLVMLLGGAGLMQGVTGF